MSQSPINNRLSGQGATAIYRAFSAYRSRFKDITRRAPLRFKTVTGTVYGPMPSGDWIYILYISTSFNKHGKTELYRHDRAGRLVDAQTFEHLKFDTSCFWQQLLAELAQDAGRTVRIGNEGLTQQKIGLRLAKIQKKIEENDNYSR